MKSYSLDTETGGFDPAACGIVEIAIVDNDTGAVVLNTLIDPGVPIPDGAMAVHGITDAMVAGMPKIAEVLPFVLALAKGSEIVIFNSQFDTRFLPGIITAASKISCCMLEAMRPMRVSRWPKLTVAAEWAGYEWPGEAHRALSDALACRYVWRKITQGRETVPEIEVTKERTLIAQAASFALIRTGTPLEQHAAKIIAALLEENRSLTGALK